MMTLDSSDSNPIAEGTTKAPEGQQITGQDEKVMSGDISVVSRHTATGKEAETWSYLNIHNMRVASFEDRVINDAKFKCFIHRTWQKTMSHGTPKKELKPTVSGLVFLQGKPDEIQKYLDEYYPPYHLVKDCSTGRPAIIRDALMEPFMKIASVHPDRVRFLRKPFVKFAETHTLLRVLTGPFAGQEGYIVRIDRDRQLVMDFGGIAVAFRGIRNEDVEPVTKN
ncbi:MAG: hypothetical protein PUE76_01360 [Bacteroides sp.]|nr:hypothetical protein [Bacteroides sp.]